jgi:Protein of unknown function (DUF3373)
MKKITLLSAIASIVCVSAFADADINARFKAMEDRLNKIEKENADLKAAVKTVQGDELGARMDEVEKLTFSNKVKFGVGMKNMDNYFSGKYADGSKYFNPNVLSTKFMLNMDSEITSDMKFTGRLSMYKNWADKTAASAGDSMDGRRANGSVMYVERAYVDWTAIKGDVPVTFTIGRQPSSDGPSHQFADNTKRKSTYSALAFDGNADGLVTTFDLEKATGMANAAIRVAYGKGFQAEACTALGCGSTGMNGGGLKDTTLYGAFIDGSIPFVDNSLVQIGIVRANDIFAPTTQGISGTVAGQTTLGGYMGAGGNVAAISNLNLSGVTNVGSVTLMGIMAEATDLQGLGLDLFAHYGMSKTTPNGANGVFGRLVDGSATAYWLGGRYDLAKLSKGLGKFGYEYNHGSKNWVSFTQGSYDITNKVATRGSVHEVYYMQPINKFAFAKIGAQNIHYDYTGSGMFWGEPIDTKSAMAGNMGTLAQKELQNIYIQFNLQY